MVFGTVPRERLQLPALPKALPSGYLRDVCARGGFELDLEWKAGRPARIKIAGSIREFPTEKGKRYVLSAL